MSDVGVDLPAILDAEEWAENFAAVVSRNWHDAATVAGAANYLEAHDAALRGLVADLRAYARHKIGCRLVNDSQVDCSCGLVDLLARSAKHGRGAYLARALVGDVPVPREAWDADAFEAAKDERERQAWDRHWSEVRAAVPPSVCPTCSGTGFDGYGPGINEPFPCESCGGSGGSTTQEEE